MSFLTDSARWRALTHRDPNANGQFVYTVKSTRCYCRPTCPARLARRANVGFFKTPAEAEAAGFRACKRCKPQEEIHEDPQERAVIKACKIIEEAIEENDSKALRLQDLAKSVGLTPRYFHKIFKDKTNLTPKEYAKTQVEYRNHETSSATPVVTDTPATFEPLNIDAFDFSSLDDFQFDPSLSLADGFTTEAPSQILPATFGQEIDVNIQSLSWNAICGPNPLAPGLDFDINKPGLQLDAFPISSTAGLQSWDAMTPLVALDMDTDAALLLGEQPYVEVLPGFGTDMTQASYS